MTTEAFTAEVEEAAQLLLARPRRQRETAAGGSGSGGAGGGGEGRPVAVGEGDRPGFLIAGPNSPMPAALDLLERWPFVRYAGNRGVTRTVYWRGEWWDHVGSHYQQSTAASMENSLWRVLNDASHEAMVGRGEERHLEVLRWEPVKTSVANVVKALEARCEVADTVEAGSWLTFPTEAWLTPYVDETRTERLIALSNVMLDPVTGETREHSDAYLNTYALPFEYDATAECPAWLAYLEGILAVDSVRLLQEWFGYVVSGRTDLQKMLFMVGPSRSGKGTIALILSRLIGLINVAGPTMNNFAGQFGLQPLISRPLAIFDDVRLPPRPDHVYTALERLLSVIGEAPLTVDRKNREPITVKLPTRIMMSANELLEFPDAVGAMQTRMLVLVFTQSFVGREKRDEEFKDLFLAELPGILNWALAGLQRLDESGGRFSTPADSTEVSEELRDAGNPVRAFTREHCELASEEEVALLKELRKTDPKAEAPRWVWADELYVLYAESHGGFKDHTAQRTRFGRELKAAHPHVAKSRRRRDGVMTYYYENIELNAEHRETARQAREEADMLRDIKRTASYLN